MYALDLPGMGYSQIVPGASYDEPAMRAAVKSLITRLDLRDVTLLGESMGATLALTTAADLPERVRRVVAINAYDYAGGIARSSLLARFVVTGALAPGVGHHRGVQPSRSCEPCSVGVSATRPPCAMTTSMNCRKSDVGPAIRSSPAPCTATCPASSRPAPATPRSAHPSTSSMEKSRLVKTLGPTSQQATPSRGRVCPGAWRRPLHRPRATGRACQGVERRDATRERSESRGLMPLRER